MSGRYDMNTRPDTWPRPDDVDAIRQQEAWEASEDYESAALDWGVNDADIVAEIKDRYAATAEYDRSFIKWMDRQLG